MNGEELYKYIVSGNMDNSLGKVLRAGLDSLSKGYTWAVNRRNKNYDQNKGVYRANLPVISVGNITAGGTGKTPMVRYICESLRQKDYKATVLSRGYRAKDNAKSQMISDRGHILVEPDVAGDEAWLLAKVLPGTSVVIGRNRSQSARLVEEESDTDVIVLDDGFQHRALARDLDLLLIDATNPFGYEHCLPRGLLREPLEGLKRAHAFILTKVDQAKGGDLSATKKRLTEAFPHTPLAETVHQPKSLYRLEDWVEGQHGQPVDAYKEEPVIAATGIGNPESFKATLQGIGYDVKGLLGFGDHHDFSNDDLVSMWKLAFTKGAKAIFITEKDAVKIAQLQALQDLPIPVYVLSIGIHFISGENEIKGLIYKTAQK